MREKTSKIRQKHLKNAFTFFNKCRFQYNFDLCTSTEISTKAVHFQYKKKVYWLQNALLMHTKR